MFLRIFQKFPEFFGIFLIFTFFKGRSGSKKIFRDQKIIALCFYGFFRIFLNFSEFSEFSHFLGPVAAPKKFLDTKKLLLQVPMNFSEFS